MNFGIALKLGLVFGGAVFGLVVGFGMAPFISPAVAPPSVSAPGEPAPAASDFSMPSFTFLGEATPSVPRTLEEILELPGDFAQTAALYELALNLDEAGIVRLLDEAVSLQPPSQGQAARSILYSKYAELNPEGAVERLLRSGRMTDSQALARVFQAWSRVDFDAALAGAMKLGMQQRVMAGMAILQSRDDLGAQERKALAQQFGLASILPQLDARRQLAHIDDPAAAWSEALSLNNPQDQMNRLRMLAEMWAQLEPEAAMAAVAALERPDLRAQLKRQVVGHWANRDLDAAVQWALGQPPSADRSSLLTTTLTALAMSNPERAMQLTSSLTGVESQQATVAVLGAWSQTDPRGAAQSLAMLQDPAMRQQAVGQIARSYASMYPDEVVLWLRDLAPTEADQATVAVVRVLARQDPLRAADLVEGVSEPNQQRNAASQLVNRWARSDPEAAVEWSSQVEDPGLRTQLYMSIMPQWARYDRDAAVSYVQTIEDVAEREAATVNVLLSVREPALMERLYEGLTLPEHKQRAAVQLFQYWRHIDPTRASTYQSAAGIGDAEAAELSGRGISRAMLQNRSAMGEVLIEAR